MPYRLGDSPPAVWQSRDGSLFQASPHGPHLSGHDGPPIGVHPSNAPDHPGTPSPRLFDHRALDGISVVDSEGIPGSSPSSGDRQSFFDSPGIGDGTPHVRPGPAVPP